MSLPRLSLQFVDVDFVTSIAWCPDGTVLSVSDDKEVIRWTAEGEKIGKVTTLSVFPTSLAWFPASGKQPQDLFAVSCTDGTLRFISKSGREEKKIAAHDGAVILLKWSHDGSALSTAGEDGDVKIWSKTGNLRSTLVSLGQSVYALAWAPDDDHLAIGHGQNLLIKSIQTNKKNLSWSAHEGLVTCVDWSLSTGLLVSGSEDCTYKVRENYPCLSLSLYLYLGLCDKLGVGCFRKAAICFEANGALRHLCSLGPQWRPFRRGLFQFSQAL